MTDHETEVPEAPESDYSTPQVDDFYVDPNLADVEKFAGEDLSDPWEEKAEHEAPDPPLGLNRG